ncbi:hypothetical protein L3Q67_31755 [Saccharothrix sp. AJ9571]|nr:hypothetical protein L3Q67_31755 [Saccharothrix sp. AJ9571]
MPQYFLDGVARQSRIVDQCLPLLRVGQQQQGAEADLDHGGLVPGEQQCHGHHGGLVVGNAFGRAQPGNHVVAGFVPLAGDQFPAVPEQFAEAAFGSSAGLAANGPRIPPRRREQLMVV